ncbi:ABC transporter permease [Paenibacillus silvisoli]|uniref:ABC transporter permease n=1 Tax=Paenibacillus silvisoli TaxID=3110539 RepID=UPI002805D978|nr:ABC transporter permease subunit [Paenibacillus silvisoli]
MKTRRNSFYYYQMLIPGFIFLIIFHIVPMFGIVIAFEKFIPAKGIFASKWIGFDNFTYMFQLPDSRQVFMNTVIIATMKIIAGLIVPVIFALALNEVRLTWFKKSIQTIVYLPHFLSWVIMSGIVINIFAYDGIVNAFLGFLGIQPTMFMASNFWFRPILVLTDVWKEFGFSTIIYLAAMTGINPTLYEAAIMDGASRRRQLFHVTLPGLSTTIFLMTILSLGNVLNAGFDQVFNLYNPLVYSTGDILDTYVFRTGLVDMQYGLATAVGLLKSVISFILIVISYKLAEKFANYRIF